MRKCLCFCSGSQVVIFLLNRHCVGEPGWVLNFADNLRIQQALYLRFDNGSLFIGHLSRLLLFWLGARPDVQAMLDDVSADSPEVTC